MGKGWFKTGLKERDTEPEGVPEVGKPGGLGRRDWVSEGNT